MNVPGSTHARLNFDQLVRAYLDNLQVNLRGFKAAESFGFLEAWVPHDDATENVIELVDLARASGLARLTILVSQQTSAVLDLRQIAESSGAPIGRDTPDGRELEFALDVVGSAPSPRRTAEPALNPSAPSLDQTVRLQSSKVMEVDTTGDVARERGAIHACYRAPLERILADVLHEVRPQPVTGLIEVAARHGDCELLAVVDPKTTVVRQAGFLGAVGPIQRGLMEMLCRAMEGRPIQECADHGAIAVEHALRDKSQPPPVSGVVTPDNADPAFQLPQTIVRLLLAEFRATTGYTDTQNFFDRPASPGWVRLSEQERHDKITATLSAHPDAADVELVRMDGLKRVVVRFRSSPPSERMQQLLVHLEAYLREKAEPTLQLTTQVRVDANILRMPEQKK